MVRESRCERRFLDVEYSCPGTTLANASAMAFVLSRSPSGGGQGIAGSDQKMLTKVLDIYIYDLVAGLLGYTIHNVIQELE